MQRPFGSSSLALACMGIGAGGAQAAQPFKPQLPRIQPGNDGIAQAFEAGRITEAAVRPRAGARGRRARPCRASLRRRRDARAREATIILRDLVARLDRLSYSERAVARRLLARPTSSFDSIRKYRAKARNKCGPRICVLWVSKTSDAPSLKDGNRNRVPDWIDLTREVTSHVWNVEVGRMGYRAPKSDIKSKNHGPNGKLDVYIADVGAIGLYGYCTTDDPSRGPRGYISAYCVVDDDFARSQFSGAAYGKRALQVTAAHEFFHAIQYGYDFLEDLWLMEGTAAWIEDEVYDTVNDNRQYLRVGPLGTDFAWLPLDHENPDFSETDSGYHYGVWIFWRYLSRAVRPGGRPQDLEPGRLPAGQARRVLGPGTVHVLENSARTSGPARRLRLLEPAAGRVLLRGLEVPEAGPDRLTVPVTNAGIALSSRPGRRTSRTPTTTSRLPASPPARR